MNKSYSMKSETKPLVAIVGRPNVGKSTLFNRLAGRLDAIVSDVAGTTRDRITTETVWGGHPFILVDTGGLELFPETTLWQKIKAQVEIAIADADVIVMVVDGATGPMPADRDVADVLRRTDKPVVLAVNKVDSDSREASAFEFHQLGLTEPLSISAYHNRGIDDLAARIVDHFTSMPGIPTQDADIKLAIVGRTNTGKSTLVNALTGGERAIVSEEPGTTRDALDTLISYDGRSILLIDTAGIRRRGSVKPGIERYSMFRAIRAIDRADIGVLLLDAGELATSQDTHVASYILDAYKGLVLAVNKWDRAHEFGIIQSEADIRTKGRFKFAPYAPVCFFSALRRSGIEELMGTVQTVHKEWSKELPRHGLRRAVLEAVARHPPTAKGRRSLKIYGVTQDQSRPPTFTFYVNRPDMVHFSYRRYLENILREAYGFEGAPLRARFKGRGVA